MRPGAVAGWSDVTSRPFAAIPIAELPQYVRDHSHWLIEVPIRIALIIVVALLIRFVLLRMIDRLMRPRHAGDMPRILRPFKEKVEQSGLLEATGLLSERRQQRATTIGLVLKSGVSFTIFVITVLVVLSELGINLAPFIAGTSIIGVALGFGAQSIVKDFLSGMFMMVEDQYGVGDVIDFQLASGVVEAVGLRTTRLRDDNGTVWYVRNGEVLRVGNSSQGFSRVIVDVPVPAAIDLDGTCAALLDEGAKMKAEPQWTPVFLSDFEFEGAPELTVDQITLRVVAKVRAGEQFRTSRELRLRLRARLDRMAAEQAVSAEQAPEAAGAGTAGQSAS
jgi:small conductance mechanosensitive channel